MLTIASVIYWQGFQSTYGDLVNNGWEVYTKGRFSRNCNRRLVKRGEYVYLRNSRSGLLGRFFYPIESMRVEQSADFELDFMVHKKAVGHARPHKYDALLENFDAQDIPALLEIVLELQNKYPSQPKSLPVAEILAFEKRSA